MVLSPQYGAAHRAFRPPSIDGRSWVVEKANQSWPLIVEVGQRLCKLKLESPTTHQHELAQFDAAVASKQRSLRAARFERRVDRIAIGGNDALESSQEFRRGRASSARSQSVKHRIFGHDCPSPPLCRLALPHQMPRRFIGTENRLVQQVAVDRQLCGEQQSIQLGGLVAQGLAGDLQSLPLQASNLPLERQVVGLLIDAHPIWRRQTRSRQLGRTGRGGRVWARGYAR